MTLTPKCCLRSRAPALALPASRTSTVQELVKASTIEETCHPAAPEPQTQSKNQKERLLPHGCHIHSKPPLNCTVRLWQEAHDIHTLRQRQQPRKTQVLQHSHQSRTRPPPRPSFTLRRLRQRPLRWATAASSPAKSHSRGDHQSPEALHNLTLTNLARKRDNEPGVQRHFCSCGQNQQKVRDARLPSQAQVAAPVLPMYPHLSPGDPSSGTHVSTPQSPLPRA